MNKKILLLLFSFIFLVNCSGIKNNFHAQNKPAHALRVASYNVNWGEASVWRIKYPEKTLSVIKEMNADILLLQETTPRWQNYLNQHLAKIYPYRIFHHYPDAGGLAVLSKYPITTLDYHHPHIGWHPGWIFQANTPIGNINFLNVHLSPPLVNETSMGLFFRGFFISQPIRLSEIEHFYGILDLNKTTIIAGDFNEGDSGSAVKFLRSHGFVDVLQQNGFASHTWLWRIGLLTFNDRYDRIFYNKNLLVKNLQVIHEGNSDHFPIAADFVRQTN